MRNALLCNRKNDLSRAEECAVLFLREIRPFTNESLLRKFARNFGLGHLLQQKKTKKGVVSLKRGNSFLVQKKHSDYENPNACGRM